MTPKAKAKEIFDKFNKPDTTHYPYVHNAQQCALIAVDEILETTKVNWATQRELPNGKWRVWKGISYKKYWIEVKQEIEKL
jgi:hypothetical protein